MNGALLDLCYAGRDANGDPRARQAEAEVIVYRADEVVEHLLGDCEVGDNAVAQRAHGNDIGRSTADHALGLRANREDLLIDPVDCDDGGLVDDDPPAFDHHEGICCPQVYRNVMGKYTENGVERVKGQPCLPGEQI